jgi:hypothetical protein
MGVVDFATIMFALDADNTVHKSRCGYPDCFTSWSQLNTTTFNESPGTFSYYDVAGNPLVQPSSNRSRASRQTLAPRARRPSTQRRRSRTSSTRRRTR